MHAERNRRYRARRQCVTDHGLAKMPDEGLSPGSDINATSNPPSSSRRAPAHAALRTPVAGGDCSAQSVQLGSLRVGEKLLVRISCRALQRRVAFLSPYSLQIGARPRAS